jgi:hypothetical protein
MTLAASMAGTLLAELLWVGVVPCAAAAVAMLIARRWALRPRAAWAASVAMGYVVGQIALVGRAGFLAALSALIMPREARDWLPWAVLLAAGATIWVAHAGDARRWIGHVLAVVIVLSAPWRLLGGSVWLVSRWSAGQQLFALAGLAGAMGIVWWLLEAAEDDDQPLVRSLLLILVAVGAAVVVTLSGSFSYGQLCGVVAAAMTGALIPGVLKHTSPTKTPFARSPNGLGGAAGVVTFSLGGLILLGYFYTELTAPNALLLAIAVVAAGGRLPMAPGMGPGLRAAARIAVCLVPLLIAVIQAYVTRMAGPASPY